MGNLSIKNEKGIAIKFPDGSMICYPDQEYVTEISNNQNSQGTYQFPLLFIEPPIITATYNGVDGNINIITVTSKTTTTSFTYLKNGTSGGRGGSVFYIACGHWK